MRRQAIINKIGRTVAGHRQAHQKRRAKRTTHQRTHKRATARRRGLRLKAQDEQSLPSTSPRAHTHISEDQRYWENIHVFTIENNGDPACEVGQLFIRLLTYSWQ